jgi:alkyl sulfatase BDS1-like metallo-beta-lactamase superfamily hydrolase
MLYDMRGDAMTYVSEPTAATTAANRAAAVDDSFGWDDRQDFDDASRGFLGTLEDTVIRDADGNVVWDLGAYRFLDDDEVPASVHPSLWRQGQLNSKHGLFEVVDGIYQVRGLDLSVMSIIAGDTGYIVIDPLISTECAAAGMGLVHRHLGEKPVVAVIYTHSHIDHYGGVKGVVDEADVKAGKVAIYAPDGFLEAAVTENVLAGNAMGRRASYQYGAMLPKAIDGQVDAGLGKTTSTGTVTLIPPTHIISETGHREVIDGIEVVFQMAPGTEAPAEMMFHFPQKRALCMAENCVHTLHNLLTLRGAVVRDAKAWSHYVLESIDLFAADTDVVFASHHWPTWGQERCENILRKQADMYKYLHDQTLRLANHGYTSLEIAEMIELPPDLAKAWFNRGYYGSVSHDVRAIYQRYLGWYNGHPAELSALAPEPAAVRYVEFMGGADTVVERARQSYDAGEYAWVAQVLTHVVFAQPDHQGARDLQAAALEQLGFQTENPTWRNEFLTGAMELRNGVQDLPATVTASPDTVRAMGVDLFLDYLGVRLNGPAANGVELTIALQVTDPDSQWFIQLRHSVLDYWEDREGDADVSVQISRAGLNDIIMGTRTLDQQVTAGDVSVTGDRAKFEQFLGLLDTFDFWFHIVTP